MGFAGVALITGTLLTVLLMLNWQCKSSSLDLLNFMMLLFSFITCMLLLCCIYQRRDIIIVYISAYADNCIKAINMYVCCCSWVHMHFFFFFSVCNYLWLNFISCEQFFFFFFFVAVKLTPCCIINPGTIYM